MDQEQEGINLETINLGTEDTINLPNVEETTEDNADNNVETQSEETTGINNNVSADDEKESLKKGINAERRARKEAEKLVKKLEERISALEEANREPEKTTLDTLIESGIDEDVARSIAGAIDKNKESAKGVMQELADMKFTNKLLEKSKESNFSDILDYSDEVKDLVDKGLTIEQAYYAINYDKVKTINTNSEIERKVEAKLQNNQARKEILGNINSNAGGTLTKNSNKPKATAEEIAIARMAGIDIDDFLNAKNADSIKQYNSNKKNK